MLFKKLRAKRQKKAKVAADAMSGSAYDTTITSVALLNDVVLARPSARDRVGHLGMQGAPPIIGISRNRIRCEGCRELVKPGVRHICMYNAHHHLDTLTADERLMLIEQLKAVGIKLS